MKKRFSLFALFLLVLSHSYAQDFQIYPDSLPGFQTGGTSWGDFDNDGYLDLVINGTLENSGSATKLFRNNHGVLEEVLANLPNLYGGSVAWGDYDNDNDIDLLLCGTDYYGNGATYLYCNDGGAFHTVPIPFTGVSVGEAAWIDYNNDGFLDVLVTGDSSYYAPVSRLYKNNGDGSFTYIPSALFPSMYSFFAIGDYDNDGDQDILLAGYGESSFVTRLYRNDSGTYVDSDIAFDSVAFADGEFVDYDKDGDMDLIFIGSNNQTQYVFKIYRNEGNGVFTDIPNSCTGEWGGEIAVADFNNDGYPDLGVTGSLCCGNALTRLYKNNGNGTFDTIPINFPPMSSSQISFGDFDNDGDADFVLTGYPNGSYFSAFTFIYQNLSQNGGLTANTPPSSPTSLASQVNDHHVSFNWQHSVDNTTASAGLTYNLRVGRSASSMEVMAPYSDPVDGFLKVYSSGNVCQDTSWSLHDLPDGRYYWSVQAIDQGHAASAFSPECFFDVGSAATEELIPSTEQIQIVPNPFSGGTVVLVDKEWRDALYRLFGMDGNLLLTGKLEGTSTLLNLSSLSTGIYILIVENNGQMIRKNIIKD